MNNENDGTIRFTAVGRDTSADVRFIEEWARQQVQMAMARVQAQEDAAMVEILMEKTLKGMVQADEVMELERLWEQSQ